MLLRTFRHLTKTTGSPSVIYKRREEKRREEKRREEKRREEKRREEKRREEKRREEKRREEKRRERREEKRREEKRREEKRREEKRREEKRREEKRREEKRREEKRREEKRREEKRREEKRREEKRREEKRREENQFAMLILDSLQPFIDKTSIIPAPSTDHHAITLKFCSFNEGKKGPSFWKFNNSLLRDEVYVKEVCLCEELGGTYRQGSLLLTYMSAMSAIGKVIFGKMSDCKRVNTLVLYQVCMVLTGLTSALSIMATDYKMLVIYVVIIGILDGSFIGLMSIVTFECCDRGSISHAWGGVLMCMSLTMLVGAPAGSTLTTIYVFLSLGWLGEATGRYRDVFYLAGGPMLLGSLLFGLIWCFKPPGRIREQTTRVEFPPAAYDDEILVNERETVL
ncbi:hypothetical protein QZH41_011255 [Actinostola sp. cb2023]|nr:hypothetical protein QZH41_011255 [Actinostola sp. cb2023]